MRTPSWSAHAESISYHLACISSVMGGAVFNQAVLVEVRAVAVRAGEGVAIRYWAELNKQKSVRRKILQIRNA